MAIVAHTNSKPMERLRWNIGGGIHGKTGSCEKVRHSALTDPVKLPGFSPLVPEGRDKFVKPLITRADDGFSSAMDRNKALGNAVVAQCFYPVFRGIYMLLKQSKEGVLFS